MATIKSIIKGILGLQKEASATTQDVAVIKAEDTNSGIAIVPNGTGAITAQVPDGTVAGGNARGDYAVDLQTTTNLADRVASGDYSVISGGRRGKSSGLFSVVGGGDTNFSTNSYSTVSGGASNNASSQYSTISGGQSNTAGLGEYATVVGGFDNTSSGPYSISGGYQSLASGYNSIALSGGTASGTRSVLVGRGTSQGDGSVSIGSYNNAIAGRSVAIGDGNNAIGGSSTAIGTKSIAYLRGQFAIGYDFWLNTPTKVQYSTVMSKKQDTLTTGDTTVLSLDGSGTTNLIIPDGNNRAWNVTVEYVGVCTAAGSGTTAVGDVVTGTDKFRFKRVGGTSTIGSVTNIELTQDATMTSAECTYTVGGSNDLQISFTAPTTANATTFKVVANVSLVEVAW